MKVAETFLLSVTVLTAVVLEASTAPVESPLLGDNVPNTNIVVNDAIKYYVYQSLANTKAALNIANTAVDEALLKATGDELDTLNTAKDFLIKLGNDVAEQDAALKAALDVGTAEVFRETAVTLNDAIIETEGELDQIKKYLDNNPGELVDKVKPEIVIAVGVMLSEAKSVAKLMYEVSLVA